MRTVFKYYKSYIPMIAAILAFLFGEAMCELALPGYMSDIINNGIVKGDMDYIRRIGLVMILVSCGSVVCSIVGSYLSARTAAGSARRIRGALFEKVTEFSSAEFSEFSTASLITRSTNDVQMVQQTTVLTLRLACFAPIMGIGAVIKALQTSVSLSWTVGVALVVIVVIMLLSFFIILPKFKVLQEKLDRINLIMKERLSGLLVIRAFTTEQIEERRFDDANEDLKKINLFVNKAMSFMMPALMFVMNGVCVLIVWAGAHLVDSQSLMIGDMLAYLQYAMHVIMSFLYITMMFIMLPRAAVSMQRIGEVIDVNPQIEDPKEPKTLQKPRGEISFDHVSFAYPDADEKTLDDISFTAKPGQTTAIIGSTGSGKSTILNLIPRFYDATEGAVRIDGMDIRDITQEELREQIGYVPQKGVLFSGTIASNLQYGKDDATDDEMIEAAETAQAMEFIRTKENGLQEDVSQGGTNVSGGQKQRLSIARALVKKARVYLFDDSFSALDFKTDQVLRKALKEKVGDSTIIIVAQRINTVLDADQIIVMDEGRMAGIGTHDELMKSCTVYKEIALSQLSEEELERGRK